MMTESGPQEYAEELKKELARLEVKQLDNPSEYKAERIARIKTRLMNQEQT